MKREMCDHEEPTHDRNSFSDLYFGVVNRKNMCRKNIRGSCNTYFLSDVISVKSYLK